MLNQIWHVFVIAGAALHFQMCIDQYGYRKANMCNAPSALTAMAETGGLGLISGTSNSNSSIVGSILEELK